MAKVIGPLHSTEARGRVDSLVYGTWRGIRFTRSYVEPVFKAPDCRTDQKARVAAANAAWMLLSQDQHLNWHSHAQAHPRSDWSGVQIRISGYNAFVSCYVISLRAGGTPLSDPPSGAPPLPLLSLSSVQIDNDIDVAWTYPTQPTAHTYKVQLLRTGPISLGKQPDKHHASILTHEAINSSPYEDAQTLDGRYGYWGRVIDSDTGETTPFLRCSTDFVFVAPAPPLPLAYVSGRLLDDSAEPVIGVFVECDGLFGSSGAGGFFQILDVPHGDHNVIPNPGSWTWDPLFKAVHVPETGFIDVGDFIGTPPD